MSGPYRDAQTLAAERELVLEQRIAAVEADLAALRTHREMLTARLARETGKNSWSPELRGLFVGAALAATALVALTIGFVLLTVGHS